MMHKKNYELKKVYLTKDYTRFNEKNYQKKYSPLTERGKIISRFVKKNKIKSVLDIGCSTGKLIRYLKKDNKNLKLCGFDIDKSLIKQAQINNPNINHDNFWIDDLLNLKSKSKFDLILCFGLLQFVKNPFKILDKLKNNLNKNGVIIISTQNFFFNFVSFNDISANFLSKVSNLKNKKFIKISKVFLKSNKMAINNYFDIKYDNKEVLNTLYLSNFFKNNSKYLTYLHSDYYNYHHNFLQSKNHKINDQKEKWKKFFFCSASLHFFKKNKII